MIILVVVLLAILSFFGISIKSIIEGESFKENFSYVWGWIKHLWNNYLIRPASYLWNDIFIDLIWGSFVDNLKRIKLGKPTTIQDNSPQVPK